METVPNFTPRAQEAIEIAKETARETSSSVIDINHLSYGILAIKAQTIFTTLRKAQIDADALESYILTLIDTNKNFPQQGVDKFAFSHDAKQGLQIAVACAEKLGHGYVGLDHLFLALSQYDDSPINSFCIEMGVDPKLVAATMKRRFSALDEEVIESPYATIEEDLPESLPEQDLKLEHLPKFAINFNELVINKKLDRVIGRSEEIKETCEILCQKKKNNPILIGDPGVGKTAVVEGLAHQIVKGEAPEHLLNKIIYGLDLGMLIAGTKYRGQFEERLKKIIKEVSAVDHVVLFIDEIHTLVGAGSAEGTMDAANMLKPALARGELVCIGATTHEEHKKTIAKDGALDRRFQAVKIEQPSKKEALEILRGIKSHYEDFHGVTYTDRSLELCVNLSDKYMGGKSFPDKAIDLLDQAGAKTKIKNYQRPQEAKDIEAEIEDLMIQEDKNPNDKSIKEKQQDLFDTYQELLTKWAEKRELSKIIVEERAVYEAVSQKAKVPLNSLYNTSIEKFSGLNKRLKEIIIGQEEAVDKIYDCLLRGHTPLKQKSKPFGAFLCLGTSGVGKTFLAKTLAREVFGGENKLIQLDMSEYSEKISATRMVGASPGYIGYEEGGQLTEKVKKNPYSVILFDEIEKADPSVCQMLLQVLEEGKLTDNFGRETSFANSIILLTGNIGASAVKGVKNMGFLEVETDTKGTVMKEVGAFFKPEFINRLDDIIVFNTFEEDQIKQIVQIELNNLKERLLESQIKLKITPKVNALLTSEAFSKKDGARPIKRLIEDKIEKPLAPLLLSTDKNFEISVKEDKIIVKSSNERQAEKISKQ